MGKKLYVGNISFKATEETIKELFSKVGEVESVSLITDAQTGRLRGFGFVEMASDEDAKKAVESLNGTAFMERTLTVNEARPQTRDKGGSGGRRSGGGGRDRW